MRGSESEDWPTWMDILLHRVWRAKGLVEQAKQNQTFLKIHKKRVGKKVERKPETRPTDETSFTETL